MMLNLYAMVGTDIMSACSTLVLWWFNVAMLRRESVFGVMDLIHLQ